MLTGVFVVVVTGGREGYAGMSKSSKSHDSSADGHNAGGCSDTGGGGGDSGSGIVTEVSRVSEVGADAHSAAAYNWAWWYRGTGYCGEYCVGIITGVVSAVSAAGIVGTVGIGADIGAGAAAVIGSSSGTGRIVSASDSNNGRQLCQVSTSSSSSSAIDDDNIGSDQ